VEDRKRHSLRDLPSVDAVLNTPTAVTVAEHFGHEATANAVRLMLSEVRSNWMAGVSIAPTKEGLAQQALAYLNDEYRPKMRSVFNLTGTVIHTNLGRALLADAAIEAAAGAMRAAVALEFDLVTGKRGERDDHVRELLCELTGSEDATVVNNNAAAVLLALNTLADGREAIVSRGELIEIGGAFRMPDVMKRAGTRLVEVGTTNRTHLEDYRIAITQETGLILKVHTSNYRILGFTSDVGVAELASVAAEANVPLMNDLGSGTLVDLTRYGLQREPTVREAMGQGANIVTFSGDKLFGGPQAGFIVGKRDLIAAINRNPMKRALRIDKIRLAAIEATLKLYRDPGCLTERLPTLRLLARLQTDILTQASRVLPGIREIIGDAFTIETCECQSQIGSGAMPLETIPSAGFCIRSKTGGRALEKFVAGLRALDRPVIGRLEDGALILDLRCLEDEAAFLSSLSGLIARCMIE
jgi:L-seryl-tRNA(Ser) seleniumtransferase